MPVNKITSPITSMGLIDKVNEVIDNLGKDYLNTLLDVTITGVTEGQVLKYDGEKWINGTIDSAGVFEQTNPQLTSVEGECVWDVTHNLNTLGVSIHVYDASTGKEVLCDKIVNSKNSVTIKLLSDNAIVAGTYKAEIVFTG